MLEQLSLSDIWQKEETWLAIKKERFQDDNSSLQSLVNDMKVLGAQIDFKDEVLRQAFSNSFDEFPKIEEVSTEETTHFEGYQEKQQNGSSGSKWMSASINGIEGLFNGGYVTKNPQRSQSIKALTNFGRMSIASMKKFGKKGVDVAMSQIQETETDSHSPDKEFEFVAESPEIEVKENENITTEPF